MLTEKAFRTHGREHPYPNLGQRGEGGKPELSSDQAKVTRGEGGVRTFITHNPIILKVSSQQQQQQQ